MQFLDEFKFYQIAWWHLDTKIWVNDFLSCSADWFGWKQDFILNIFNLIITLLHVGFRFQNVLDGDLCEQYNAIDAAKQKSIAEDLDRTPSEVSKKLEDIRTRYAF